MTSIIYDGASGVIQGYGQFDAAPDGLLLGYVLDDAPLHAPGAKTLEAGVVVVTPPPGPTPEEVAAEEAAQAADAHDAELMATLYPTLVAAIPTIPDPNLQGLFVAVKGIVDRMQRKGL